MTEVLERARTRYAPPPATRTAAAHGQWTWIAAGLVFAFLVPFVFADRLALPRDAYYAVYVGSVAGFVAAWGRAAGLHVRDVVRRRWAWGIALGALFAGVMALIVLRSEDATAHPGGIALVAAILWRGIVYGAADGVLLSVFPILAVFAAFRDGRFRRRLFGRGTVAVLALVVSLAMTASYHLGYSDFRSQKVAKTLVGDVVWSAPTLITLSPLGAPLAHVGLHVTAVIHSYHTDLYLPPHA